MFSRKRVYQLEVQGYFKADDLAFSDVVLREVCKRQMKGVPARRVLQAIRRFVEAITPGMIFDVADEQWPKRSSRRSRWRRICGQIFRERSGRVR